ncbi:MAG: P1 family peptidase [Bacteroidota bacterium]
MPSPIASTPSVDSLPKHDLFKLKGLKIGQMEDSVGITGCTVFLFEKGATAGVDVRGAAPGSRELASLEPGNLVEEVHAIVLSGGSAFGLASMSGVADYLETKGIGYDVGVTKVPIVVGAVLFDLTIGDHTIRPDYEMGYQAAKQANDTHFSSGNHGAGMGATVGKVKGMEYATKSGIGSATLTFKNGLIVSAVVAVNALGNVYEGDRIIAGMLNKEKDGYEEATDYILNGYKSNIFAGSNTTIGVVLTNAKLSKAQCRKLAQTSHDAYAARIRPTHTLYDGDTIFAAATGEIEFNDALFLSVAANRAMEQAILNAVKEAEDISGFTAGGK